MSKLTKSFKGQISNETEKAIQIDVMTTEEIFSTWVPKSALNMEEMNENYLSVTGIQTFHVVQWFLDMKKTEAKDKARKEADNTKATFLKTVVSGTIPVKTQTVELGTYSKEKGVGTMTIDMPQPPTPDRVEHPYFPGMTIFELRDYHKHEREGAIRGHIENIIMMKELVDQVKFIADYIDNKEGK